MLELSWIEAQSPAQPAPPKSPPIRTRSVSRERPRDEPFAIELAFDSLWIHPEHIGSGDSSGATDGKSTGEGDDERRAKLDKLLAVTRQVARAKFEETREREAEEPPRGAAPRWVHAGCVHECSSSQAQRGSSREAHDGVAPGAAGPW